MTLPLQNPDVGIFAFFNGQTGQQNATAWGNQICSRLGIPELNQQNPSRGTNPDKPCYVSLYPLQDALVVYVSVEIKGICQSGAWTEVGEAALGKPWQLPQGEEFWGVSFFFGATVTIEELPAESVQRQWIAHTPTLETKTLAPVGSIYPWGSFWQVAGTSNIEQVVPHLYVLLFLPEYAVEIQKQFFCKGEKGLGFLSSNLAKAYRQLADFYQLRNKWKEKAHDLEESLQLLRGQPITDDAALQQNLSHMWHEYVDFNRRATSLAQLQQTIALNMTNYRETAEKLALSLEHDPIIKSNLGRWERGREQLLADVYYNEVTKTWLHLGLESVQTQLDFLLAKEQHRLATEQLRLGEQQGRLFTEQVQLSNNQGDLVTEQNRLVNELVGLARDQKDLAKEQKRLAEEQKRLAEEQRSQNLDQQAKDKQDKRRDLALTLVGALLASAQIYPFVQDMMDNWAFCSYFASWRCSASARTGIDFLLLLVLIGAFIGAYRWWKRQP